ncbi:MAG: gliding motility-associated C-terminal domain-containing protein, partial [Bacteroidetes bacterium]|nr:gliding motility-associated C-terminal domain-containing protein [Bacteroidota bacterium]
ATGAGSITSDATVCSGTNGATLTLTGHNGTIVKWQSSTDNFVTPVDIANVTSTQTYSNITASTQYRAVVKSGTCSSANSATATITVDAATVAGSVTSDATVCSGLNGATLTLTGHNGTIVKWQSSTDNFVTPVDIANVTSTQTYSNITASTQYRAVVKSGTCASANSATASITVDAATVAGSVTSDATVCSGANGATLTLAGHNGTIVKWQSSTDNFATPVDIANVTTTQTYSNITASTKYRAVVKSGTCSSANSATASITVDAASATGTVSTNATVCSGNNSGTLTLSGQIGAVLNWESSTDNFLTSTTIANVTSSQSYNNLSASTKYRAVVKSGACPSGVSAEATITVDPISVGGIISSDATVCSGTNGATLTLSGHTGTVNSWESSTDDFNTKTTIANTTNTLTYNNISASTKYRAVVKSGTCATANSAEVTITVDPISIGGTVTSDAIVCSTVNSGTLTVAGYTGAVSSWESSTDNFNTTTTIPNSTTTLAYSNISKSTKYRAIITSGTCASTNSSAATITVDPISITLANDTICDKTSNVFNAAPGFVNYSWSGVVSHIGQSITAKTAGTYIITVSDSLGCVASASANLIVNPIPQPHFAEDTMAVCSGSTVVLNPGTSNSLNYVWNSLQTSSTITTGTAGQHIVTVSDGIGCYNKDTVVVLVKSLPVVSLGNDLSICENGFDKLTLTAQYSGNYQTLWSNSETNVKSILIEQPGSYWVEVSDANNCTATDAIEITAYCDDITMDWPDVITPNGDGINDNFKPKGVDDSNFQKIIANIHIISFGVYDRWGRFMFYSEEDILPFWDGKFNGDAAASGTYFYVIKYKNSAGKVYEIANYMSLIN